ncbi:phosphatase PAP2 family protein [Streptomyces arenae]|uniref:phosphatase PAP2 family protein n=1 Tax=Streptomyces arenae TaxID=29301 RepID=UPI00265A43D1|nr:phosphatase PAP2 family protein [Streptomyces arenae]MCG7208121.1 phosphatase PAP2 family protein [Streptomyces arenae]
MNRKRVTEFAGSAALGAWVAFGALALVVSGRHGVPLALDRTLHAWSLGHRPDMAVAVARGITVTGTGLVPYALVVLAGLLTGRTTRRRLGAVLLGVFCLALGQTARYAVMELVARPRPAEQDWQTHASGWSFPSGHSTTAALTAGLVLLAMAVRAPHGRWGWRATVVCWALAVGLTRIYLGVHWFTDVLGGWLFAVGWLGVWVCVAARLLPRRWLPPGPDTPAEAPDLPAPTG